MGGVGVLPPGDASKEGRQTAGNVQPLPTARVEVAFHSRKTSIHAQILIIDERANVTSNVVFTTIVVQMQINVYLLKSPSPQ